MDIYQGHIKMPEKSLYDLTRYTFFPALYIVNLRLYCKVDALFNPEDCVQDSDGTLSLRMHEDNSHLNLPFSLPCNPQATVGNNIFLHNSILQRISYVRMNI